MNVFRRLLAAIWSGADGVRKVLHLALLLVVFVIFVSAMSTAPVRLPDKAALVISPYGALVEQLEGDPFDRALAELADDGQAQTLVKDITDALSFARDDDRIQVVYLELSSLSGSGLNKLQKVAAGIEDFKLSGKPVIANADFLNQQSYYLAAHADSIYLHPDGLLVMRGFGRFRNYFKDAIDFLRIDWNVFRVGTHKSFVEPYMRMDMSDEDRETTRRLIDQLWALYQSDVETARGLEDGSIEDFTTNFLEKIEAANGDIAIAARDHGLIDEVLTRTEVRNALIEHVGADPEYPDTFSGVEMYEYLSQMRAQSGGTADKSKNVAVIVAAGEILFGSQPPGTIGGDSTAALLRRARNDESVKAVVLRVDSPGGSKFASEVIVDEIRALRDEGIPVVASMSSVAASGGYAISMYADRIFASPSTITGSIGIFGMFPTFQRTFEAIGIATDGIGTTPWSGEFRPDRPMSKHAKQLFQLVINDGYDDFISDVADSRNMDKITVDQIGQGQVWTGMDALNNGLIDELGDIDDAIAAAAELADLEEGDYGFKYIEQELSPGEQFVVDLIGFAAKAGFDLSGMVGRPSLLEKLAREVDAKTRTLLRFNDPKGVYSHCLCDIW